MPVQQCPINPIFLQNKLQLLRQRIVNLTRRPCQHLFPRHGRRLSLQVVRTKLRNWPPLIPQMNYLAIRGLLFLRAFCFLFVTPRGDDEKRPSPNLTLPGTLTGPELRYSASHAATDSTRKLVSFGIIG